LEQHSSALLPECTLIIKLSHPANLMRMGEINGLKLEDVDLEKRLIHIERTITKNENSKAIVGTTTKTYSGVRTIPIPPVLINVFQEASVNEITTIYSMKTAKKFGYIHKDTSECWQRYKDSNLK